MANAPAHSKNSAIDKVTVFNSDGNEVVVTRLNAIDLIRGGSYYWKSDDVTAERPEADGPADPKAETVTIFSPEGTPHEMSQANARDMVTTAGYFWNDPNRDEKKEALAAVIDAAEAVVASEAAPTVDTSVDVNKESLADQAMRVAGHDDVVKYLEGFSEERLRDMALQRYNGLKVHHRASKETAIVKIIEAENAAQVAPAV
jgi:hypothetical protein